MEIQVRCKDGEFFGFTMRDDRRCLELIESINPSEFFSRPPLRIQGGKRTSIFSLEAVESIYFDTSLKAKTREQPMARGPRIIPEKEYLERLELLKSQCESNDDIFEIGKSVETLAAVHCASGKIYYMQVEVVAQRRLEQLLDLHSLMGRLISAIPCAPEGYLAINPSHIKKIDIYPAPPETSLTAWLVE